MSKIYILQGIVSREPVYWEAIEDDRLVRQIDEGGQIARRRSDLRRDALSYWGVVTQHGKYGFDLKNNTVVIDGISFHLGAQNDSDAELKSSVLRIEGELFYRRNCVIGQSSQQCDTVAVEIGVGLSRIVISLYPDFKVILKS